MQHYKLDVHIVNVTDFLFTLSIKHGVSLEEITNDKVRNIFLRLLKEKHYVQYPERIEKIITDINYNIKKEIKEICDD